MPTWSSLEVVAILDIMYAIIGSDNGFSPVRCQAIIWTSGGLSLTGPLGTNLNEVLIKLQQEIQENAVDDVACNMAVILFRLQCASFGV